MQTLALMRKTVIVTSGYPQGVVVLVRKKHQGQASAQHSTDPGRQPIYRG